MYRLQNLEAGKGVAISVIAIMGIFTPIIPLTIIVTLFIVIDCVVGIIVSKRIRKQGFVTHKFYNTIYKLIGAWLSIMLAFLIEKYIFKSESLYISHGIAGIICGADFWSILSNFAILSNHPVFRLIQKWAKAEIANKIGTLGQIENEQGTEKQ
jgi:hypothetical protein